MAVECTIFGLGVRVNRTLEALSGMPAASRIDVTVIFGLLPFGSENAVGVEVEEFYVSPYSDKGGNPNIQAVRLLASGATRMSYADGTVFVISEHATHVWATTPPDQTAEDTAAYLLGPIIGAVLRMRGIMCLHASAIAINNRAVALVGVSGSGKSTTAAAFAKLGYPILSDDILALTDRQDGFLVRPAYPRVRLWPESAAGLFGSADMLPCMTPNWSKRFLGLNERGYEFQSEPLELAAIYFLGPRMASGSGGLVAEDVAPAAALMGLLSNSYAANYVYKPFRVHEFEILSRLVQFVSCRRISAVDDFARIDEFCDGIMQDFQGHLANDAPVKEMRGF